jgi:hypothetical protein
VLELGGAHESAINDLSISFSDDPERDKQIFDFVDGRTEAEVRQRLGVTTADIHRALDLAGQAMLSPQNRCGSLLWMRRDVSG